MIKTITGAKRYNDKLDKIFEKAKGEKRGLVGNSGLKGHGVNSKAMVAVGKKQRNVLVKLDIDTDDLTYLINLLDDGNRHSRNHDMILKHLMATKDKALKINRITKQ